jgi:purine catabolism regulator
VIFKRHFGQFATQGSVVIVDKSGPNYMKQPLPSLTVGILFREVFPKHAFLVSGSTETSFNWVRIIATEEEIAEHASSGDLILISAKMLENHTNPTRLITQVVARLIQLRIKVFCISGLVGITALEDALRNNMTVICLPPEASMETIERLTLRLLTEQQSRAEKVENQLKQAIGMPGNPYQNIITLIEQLAELINRPVVLHDVHYLRLTQAFPREVVNPIVRWKHHLLLLDNDKHLQNMVPGIRWGMEVMENADAFQITVATDAETLGYLTILNTPSPLEDLTPLILKKAVQLCAQQLNKYYASAMSQDQGDNWIAEWLNTPSPNDVVISARAEQLGFKAEQVYVVMVLRWLGTASTSLRRPVTVDQLTSYVSNDVQTRRISAIVGHYMDRAIIFLPLEQAQHTRRMKHYAEGVCQTLSSQFGGGVVAGVGRPAKGLAELRKSFEEAERAHLIAAQVWGTNQTKFFGDLRLSELILSIGSVERIKEFFTDWLYNILTYDQESRSDLLKTMAAYFENNGNMAATAKQLNVHRNTLVYRLNRIADITQLDMDDADVQLNLHLAIKTYELLETMGLLEA